MEEAFLTYEDCKQTHTWEKKTITATIQTFLCTVVISSHGLDEKRSRMKWKGQNTWVWRRQTNIWGKWLDKLDENYKQCHIMKDKGKLF